MDQSPRLSLSYLMPAQAQKHVTVNETFRRLDQLVQQTVLSRTVAAEPGAPSDGDAYILPAIPTGTAWATFAQNNIAAYQDGGWTQISAIEGFSAWVADADEFIIYDGAAWNPVSGGGGETAAKFGVNTTADATNKLTVKSNAVLFDALDVAESGTGDSQVKVNKEAVGDTASHLFQTGFSGRAEFGLTGDDDFHVKVSANGSSWTEAIVIDKDNGRVGLGTNTPAATLDVFDGTIRLTASDGGRLIELTDLSGATNNGAIRIYNDAGTEQIRMSSVTDSWVNLNFGVGTSSPGARFSVQGGGAIFGSPTGGDKGAGTINAQDVYDDNTLLTCYVFDQMLDGAINDQKWDGKVPDRIIPAEKEFDEETGQERVIKSEETIARTHEPMRKFRARIGTPEDPLTLDGYAKHWRERRHLTSMPNEAAFDPASGLPTGKWVQRLVETVEIQAVLIEELNQRLKMLETAKPVR
ncbi:MAG: DUF2793 domain-containing protein [Alphaproteobacteria bacterium]|nr:DUF2793 domain-containing protein [Alphaproteobacteria bacterium]